VLSEQPAPQTPAHLGSAASSIKMVPERAPRRNTPSPARSTAARIGPASGPRSSKRAAPPRETATFPASLPLELAASSSARAASSAPAGCTHTHTSPASPPPLSSALEAGGRHATRTGASAPRGYEPATCMTTSASTRPSTQSRLRAAEGGGRSVASVARRRGGGAWRVMRVRYEASWSVAAFFAHLKG